MLDSIVLGKEKSKLILLTDTVECKGNRFLRCLVKNSSATSDYVVIVLLQNKRHFLDGLTTLANIEMLKPYEDPLGWIGKDLSVKCSNLCNDLVNYLKQHAEKKVTVIFDDISDVIVQHSITYACQMLHKISNMSNDFRSIALLHRDLHDENIVDLVEHQASTVINLHPGQEHFTVAKILHKRLTGKVLKSAEYFALSDSLDLADIQDAAKVVISEPQSHNLAPDPTANLTFNLSLSEREKEDRKNAPLPYMHHVATPGNGGKIFYQPDDADDFDEEDPDDDLDI